MWAGGARGATEGLSCPERVWAVAGVVVQQNDSWGVRRDDEWTVLKFLLRHWLYSVQWDSFSYN